MIRKSFRKGTLVKTELEGATPQRIVKWIRRYQLEDGTWHWEDDLHRVRRKRSR